ncbi:MAG: hypothetical protein GYA24_13140 [Candidatus Lokiarchaeota archaeon]|nr:hypothetical protein [Candidatus Lokiarchaeota archaeon]
MKLPKSKISKLLERSMTCLERQQPLVVLTIDRAESIVVIGDTHGDVEGVRLIARTFLDASNGLSSGASNNETRLVFLGDYVDRDDRDLENLLQVLTLMVQYPGKVFVLRGNHEERTMNLQYGFMDTLESRGISQAYPTIEHLFTRLPVACIIRPLNIFCCHGMTPVSPVQLDLADIARVQPRSSLAEFDDLAAQLLWNDPDPDEKEESSPSFRGIGYIVGRRDVETFMKHNTLRMVIRSHQAFPHGYRFFFDKRILSIFSKPNYNGGNNPASIARIQANGCIDVLTRGHGDDAFTISDAWKLA